MIRHALIVLGTVLAILGLTSLRSADPTWLAWAHLAGGLASYATAGALRSAPIATARGGAVALAAVLFVVWFLALFADATPWRTWLTFAFAVAYLLVGLLPTGRGLGAARRPSVV